MLQIRIRIDIIGRNRINVAELFYFSTLFFSTFPIPVIVGVSAEIAETNKQAGKEFLAENAKRSGVVVLPSGLQYEVLAEGKGRKPKATDKVQCHYHGTLIDGQVFDSSIQRGTPAVFGVNQVIPGWVEALQLMPEGSRWKLYIPSDLAYGEQGAGGSIPANATLIFEVELIKIL